MELTSDNKAGDDILDCTTDVDSAMTFYIKVGYTEESEKHDISFEGIGAVVGSNNLIKECMKRSDRDVCLLLHNPEAYVNECLSDPNVGREKGMNTVRETFERIEKELIGKNVISSTGIASNGLSLPSSHPLHYPYPGFLPKNSTVMLPLNLLENSAIPLIGKGGKGGHNVIASRPLKAYPDGVGGEYFNIRDYDGISESAGGEYGRCYKEILGYFDAEELVEELRDEGGSMSEEERKEINETVEGCRIIQKLLLDHDKSLESFKSMSVYDSYLSNEVIPVLNNTFEGLDEDTSAALTGYFKSTGDYLRFSTARDIRKTLVAKGHKIGEGARMQEYAVEWCLRQEGVGGVSVGMRSEEYVDDFFKGGEK